VPHAAHVALPLPSVTAWDGGRCGSLGAGLGADRGLGTGGTKATPHCVQRHSLALCDSAAISQTGNQSPQRKSEIIAWARWLASLTVRTKSRGWRQWLQWQPYCSWRVGMAWRSTAAEGFSINAIGGRAAR